MSFSGGWCTSPANCLIRSKTRLGSSSSYNATHVPDEGGQVCHRLTTRTDLIELAGNNGLLSTDPRFNPNFYNWNLVYVYYCDGASFRLARYVSNHCLLSLSCT